MPIPAAIAEDLYHALDADYIESRRDASMQYRNAPTIQILALALFLHGKYKGHRAPRSGSIVNRDAALRSRPKTAFHVQLLSNGDGTARFVHTVEKS